MKQRVTCQATIGKDAGIEMRKCSEQERSREQQRSQQCSKSHNTQERSTEQGQESSASRSEETQARPSEGKERHTNQGPKQPSKRERPEAAQGADLSSFRMKPESMCSANTCSGLSACRTHKQTTHSRTENEQERAAMMGTAISRKLRKREQQLLASASCSCSTQTAIGKKKEEQQPLLLHAAQTTIGRETKKSCVIETCLSQQGRAHARIHAAADQHQHRRVANLSA